MKSEILRRLVQAHAESDEAAFHKAALQLASAESAAGHVRIADELRSMIAKLGPPTPRSRPVVDIAEPRGQLADILEGGHRDERLRDVVLPDATREKIDRVIRENRSRGKLEKWGVGPRRRVLFHGPPGCGKTLTAAALAGELGLPLMTVRVDALFSRFLGATATHLRAIFAEMPRRPGVYLFDEFDAVAKARGDAQDVGEMGRIVTAFLQLIDADASGSLLVAATNHSQLLDHAVFRRFDLILPFQLPTREQIEALLQLRLQSVFVAHDVPSSLTRKAEGLSFADVARACDDAIRSMALDGREKVTVNDVEGALEEVRARGQDLR
jgi:SpoVK/Ycf46/Vps4 family AAA+-type ATPase